MRNNFKISTERLFFEVFEQFMQLNLNYFPLNL
jgi:hypothetical protein